MVIAVFELFKAPNDAVDDGTAIGGTKREPMVDDEGPLVYDKREPPVLLKIPGEKEERMPEDAYGDVDTRDPVIAL